MKKVSVVITTYNHEKYIAQCFDSILTQQGDFEMEIVVGNDCSTDRTGEIIEEYRLAHPDLIRVLPNEKNVGITKNLKRCLDACTGDFIAICEGDDYWTKPYKLQKQMEFLESHPDFSMCFSLLTLYYEQEDQYVLFEDQVTFPRDELTIHDLIPKNIIGNFSCCMYRMDVVRRLSPKMFEFFTVDWMFNMACSEMGKLGFLRETMSVYRKHTMGAWTGKPVLDQVAELLVYIDTYNHFLGYRYHEEFTQYKKILEGWMVGNYGQETAQRIFAEAAAKSPYPPPASPVVAPHEPVNGASTPSHISLRNRLRLLVRKFVVNFKNTFRPTWHKIIRMRNRVLSGAVLPPKARWWLTGVRDRIINGVRHIERMAKNRLMFRDVDLLIMDTVFPHPLSPFRFHEFIRYLEEFPRAKVFLNGEHLHLLAEKRSAEDVIAEFEEKFPQHRGRVAYEYLYAPEYVNGKLAYATFLNNIDRFIDSLEVKNIPFVFTLYPGGGFQIDQPESDSKLRRALGSPLFRKVIVTQKITQDYLLRKGFCRPEQIEFVYGVVTPPEANPQPVQKKRYGFDKETLDICFVAYKYTDHGVDKGYDVFVDVAKELARRHENVRFHVVGNFDSSVIPVEALDGKITFYGVRQRSWFRDFYADKDVILSPNTPFVLQQGAFDGFPTSSCTDAGLQGVAVFCTDDLGQNICFKDRDEMVIISHDACKIADTIEHYYQHPEEIRTLAERGAAKMQEIYSDGRQLEPRLRILKEVLGQSVE